MRRRRTRQVAAARPDDHVELYVFDFSRLTDHPAARRDPAFEEVCAELDAVSAGDLAARTPETESMQIS